MAKTENPAPMVKTVKTEQTAKMELPATSQKTKKSTDTTCSAAMKKSDPS